MIGTKYYYLYRLQHCGTDNHCNHKKLLNEKIDAQEKMINKRTTFPQIFLQESCFLFENNFYFMLTGCG